jgi:hypothetical protein
VHKQYFWWGDNHIHYIPTLPFRDYHVIDVDYHVTSTSVHCAILCVLLILCMWVKLLAIMTCYGDSRLIVALLVGLFLHPIL